MFFPEMWTYLNIFSTAKRTFVKLICLIETKELVVTQIIQPPLGPKHLLLSIYDDHY